MRLALLAASMLTLTISVAAQATTYVFETTILQNLVSGAYVDVTPRKTSVSFTLGAPTTSTIPSGGKLIDFPVMSYSDFGPYNEMKALQTLGGTETTIAEFAKAFAFDVYYNEGVIGVSSSAFSSGLYETAGFEITAFPESVPYDGEPTIADFENSFKRGTVTFTVGYLLTDFRDVLGQVAYQGSARLLSIDGVAVSDVPEPATWMIFIGGFGLVGGALRRRAKAPQGYCI